ncbi:unnamed protein product [Urochloa decumbens]|uniref:Uncharacterized protein n=1 Tax=Urochloa decumbens TaxID=240449 RepID=A0ABC9GJG4_9POAL
MVSKFALAALVLLVVVGGELGHAVPLRRGLGLGWMNGMRGGSPGGMQPSETKLQATEREERFTRLMRKQGSSALCQHLCGHLAFHHPNLGTI